MSENEKRLLPSYDPVYAIENNTVVLYITKTSFNLDLSPQGKSKVSTWGSFEPSGILPVVLELEEFDFVEREDGSKALSEQGAKDLFVRVMRLGIPGTRGGYNDLLLRDDDF
ncbi:MAG: hypothetical protein H8D45_06740 [Bacteroidetes bacterium]|nr:hypothetical protein [Bacteroidota bacterium]